MRLVPTIVAFAATTAAAASDCASGLHIIVARGSLEPQGLGLTGSLANKVVKRVPGSRAVALKFPATELNPFYSESEGQGVGNMTKDVLDYHSKCPDSMMALMGWSQGGQVIMDTVCGGAANGFRTDPPISVDIVKNNIVAMTIFGDPTWVPGYPYDVGTSKHKGQFDRAKNSSEHCVQFQDRFRSYCDKGDFWCNQGNTSSVHSSYFDKYDTQIVDFVVDQWDKLGSKKGGGSGGGNNATPTPTTGAPSSTGTGGGNSASGTGSSPSSPSNTGGAGMVGVSTGMVLAIPAVLAWML